jgi:hypothetical protein
LDNMIYYVRKATTEEDRVQQQTNS